MTFLNSRSIENHAVYLWLLALVVISRPYRESHFEQFEKSSKYNEKSKGPSIDPWTRCFILDSVFLYSINC